MFVMRHAKYKKFYAQKQMTDDQQRVYRGFVAQRFKR